MSLEHEIECLNVLGNGELGNPRMEKEKEFYFFFFFFLVCVGK